MYSLLYVLMLQTISIFDWLGDRNYRALRCRIRCELARTGRSARQKPSQSPMTFAVKRWPFNSWGGSESYHHWRRFAHSPQTDRANQNSEITHPNLAHGRIVSQIALACSDSRVDTTITRGIAHTMSVSV